MEEKGEVNRKEAGGGEAQNVNKELVDSGELINNDKDASHATSKAMQGINEDRDSDRSQQNNMSGSR